MAESKIQEFLKEFPWIRKVLGNSTLIYRVYVSRAEPSLVDYFLEEPLRGAGFFDDEEYSGERMFLIDKWNGVISYQAFRRKYFFFGPMVPGTYKSAVVTHRDCSLGSFVRERFEKDGRADNYDVRFILSYYERTNTVIVYKLPKGTTLATLMNDARKIAREDIRKEMTNENF